MIICLVFGLYFFYLFNKTFFWDNTKFVKEVKYIYIKDGETFESLCDQLSPYLNSISDFTIAAKKKGYINNIKPGKYAINKGSNNNEIINSLRSKNLTVKVTFNNQERLEDLAGRVAEQIAPDSITLLRAFSDTIFLKKNGFTKYDALSMYLPNTYEFFWDSSALKFREKMWKSYKKFWTKARVKKANEIGLNPKNVISLASVVQKESQKSDERPKVAGVYINRLKRKMKLQADPTIIYALKLKYENFDTVIKRVLYKDLKIKSPFNTYLKRGLPPGPITMPDLSTIDAVLNYERHNFLYFVANPNQPGYHLFATNARSHNKNKKIYTDWLNRNRVYR
tara:strand:- start:822 stop:1835 length:1014 start_codon:yes stop_codon:yes gene_type:complete